MVDHTGVGASSARSGHRVTPWQGLWQRLSMRLLLLLGIVVFGAAVGVDSLQQAIAADMTVDAIAPNLVSPMVGENHPDGSASLAGTYLEFDAETAQRLQRSDLLSSRLTRSRLTSAHLFASR
ncbi:hypothetical protein [Leptolyngbya iicbica]|uniref:Uncharacterized protein n=2 Tax=Cyanophyceae TaxID=3028117 RepID=A0A4V2E1V1_9CYAN|nr:hypothetical protein [Leptolyngbya sp. LK]RZM75397.1 hypothetical protein DYY88_20900 [Leptolyngbya sp. LK]